MNKPWPSPAKINRFLHVLGRREDCYHSLQTAFQFLDYSDELTFTLRDDERILLLNALEGVPPEQNLIVKAAQFLQAKCTQTCGVEISLTKKIPMGGGLGGGSSNAATTLVALNELWGLNLSEQSLANIGLQLGADVPVFIYGRAAWAEGVGEQLQELTLDEPWFCVIVPAVSVSTADIFADEELTRNSPPIKIVDFMQGNSRNDCEAVVCKRYPDVAEAIEWLQAHADSMAACTVKTRMTGTGACLFAGFETMEAARSICEQVPDKWQAFVAAGSNQSPLLTRLAQENSPT